MSTNEPRAVKPQLNGVMGQILPQILPSREQLLRWLQSESTNAPEAFDLGAAETYDEGDGEPTCPLLSFMQTANGFEYVESDGWDAVVCHTRGGGATVRFDLNQFPAVNAYMMAFKIIRDELEDETEFTRDEVVEVLKAYDNPHAIADAIKYARAFTSAAKTFTGEISC